MKITLVLALLGVATFATTVISLRLRARRRRTAVVVLGPAIWVVRRQSRPAGGAARRKRSQVHAMPRRLAAA